MPKSDSVYRLACLTVSREVSGSSPRQGRMFSRLHAAPLASSSQRIYNEYIERYKWKDRVARNTTRPHAAARQMKLINSYPWLPLHCLDSTGL